MRPPDASRCRPPAVSGARRHENEYLAFHDALTGSPIVRLASDDFGTGHASPAYLKRLPVDELKIDRGFVGAMCSSAEDAVIVQSTIDLGRNLGLCVVAEGAQSDDALRRLTSDGCDLVQGFGVSRPLEPGRFAAWVAERRDAQDALRATD